MTVTTIAKFKLDHYINSGDIKLERGKVISKVTMANIPGPYPVYSSSVNEDALFGIYGRYMFDEELITWSVDGGGNFFYRPKHKFSVTNVSGILKLISDRFIYKYLFYLLDWEHKFYTFDYVEKAHPSVIRKLYDIYDIKLAEQQKISEILTVLDETIKETDLLIEKYERIKQGLMQDLFRYGIDENGQIRNEKTHNFKDSPLGRIPEEWNVDNVFNNVRIINGGTPSTSNPLYWNGDINWLSVEDFNKPSRYVYNASKSITQLGLKNSNTNILKKGMLIISARGTVGVIAQLGCDMAFNQSCYGLDGISSVKNDYLYYSVKNYLQSLKQQSYGNVFDTITRETFNKINIVIPSIPEQIRISSVLANSDMVIEKEEKYRQKLISIKHGLMNDLLSGKVRVNHLMN